MTRINGRMNARTNRHYEIIVNNVTVFECYCADQVTAYNTTVNWAHHNGIRLA